MGANGRPVTLASPQHRHRSRPALEHMRQSCNRRWRQPRVGGWESQTLRGAQHRPLCLATSLRARALCTYTTVTTCTSASPIVMFMYVHVRFMHALQGLSPLLLSLVSLHVNPNSVWHQPRRGAPRLKRKVSLYSHSPYLGSFFSITV